MVQYYLWHLRLDVTSMNSASASQSVGAIGDVKSTRKRSLWGQCMTTPLSFCAGPHRRSPSGLLKATSNCLASWPETFRLPWTSLTPFSGPINFHRRSMHPSAWSLGVPCSSRASTSGPHERKMRPFGVVMCSVPSMDREGFISMEAEDGWFSAMFQSRTLAARVGVANVGSYEGAE